MMDDWSLHDRVAASIPFRLKDRNGQVSVFYGASNDPVRAGFDSLPGLSFDIDRCRGYPIMHARIESYEGSGYRTFCGWVQVVTNLYRDSHDPEKAQSESFVSVDVAPAFQETNIPFASYGNMPQFFDAPCLNLGRYAELQWTADTFLTSIPTRSRDEEIMWLLGFRWGYIENDIPGESPRLLPMEVTDAQVWNQHLPSLREQYGNWTFKDE